MGFLRSAELRNTGGTQKCAEAFPKLAELADPKDPDLRLNSDMEKVRDLAVELATQEAIQRQDALHRESSTLPDGVKQTRRQQLERQFKRLLPGTTVSLKGLLSDDGAYSTDPATVAALLTKHWGDTLKRKPIDQTRLRDWLTEV
jgi:hypothetical protein